TSPAVPLLVIAPSGDGGAPVLCVYPVMFAGVWTSVIWPSPLRTTCVTHLAGAGLVFAGLPSVSTRDSGWPASSRYCVTHAPPVGGSTTTRRCHAVSYPEVPEKLGFSS